MKRLITAFIAALMLILLCIPAFADYTEGTLYYTVENESITITGCFGRDETVDIPAMIAGIPVNKIAAGAFINNKYIKTINLPDTITSIEENAISPDITVNFAKNILPGQTAPGEVDIPDNSSGEPAVVPGVIVTTPPADPQVSETTVPDQVVEIPDENDIPDEVELPGEDTPGGDTPGDNVSAPSDVPSVDAGEEPDTGSEREDEVDIDVMDEHPAVTAPSQSTDDPADNTETDNTDTVSDPSASDSANTSPEADNNPEDGKSEAVDNSVHDEGLSGSKESSIVKPLMIGIVVIIIIAVAAVSAYIVRSKKK